MPIMPNYTGSCYCGKVTFKASGPPIFNVLCHCRPCSRARGASPMHLYGVKEDAFQFTSGESLVKVTECPADKVTATYADARPMTHAFCTECGSFVYQRPKGAGFRALSPVTFCIETKLEENKEDGEEDPSSSAVLRSSMCGVSCLLPAELLPTQHVNYENRLRDYHDDLPKWRTFAHRKVRLTNSGTPTLAPLGEAEEEKQVQEQEQEQEVESAAGDRSACSREGEAQNQNNQREPKGGGRSGGEKEKDQEPNGAGVDDGEEGRDQKQSEKGPRKEEEEEEEEEVATGGGGEAEVEEADEKIKGGGGGGGDGGGWLLSALSSGVQFALTATVAVLLVRGDI
jgi:hypothetical protein